MLGNPAALLLPTVINSGKANIFFASSVQTLFAPRLLEHAAHPAVSFSRSPDSLQSGFHPLNITETALDRITDNPCQGLGLYFVLILLDISTDFGTANHSLLLQPRFL